MALCLVGPARLGGENPRRMCRQEGTSRGGGQERVCLDDPSDNPLDETCGGEEIDDPPARAAGTSMSGFATSNSAEFLRKDRPSWETAPCSRSGEIRSNLHNLQWGI